MDRTRATVELSTWARMLDATTGSAAAPPVRIQVPARIGPMELLREVGRGGMGVVWRARHEVLARDVAVKFLLAPAVVSDPGGQAAEVFVQGARAAAEVRHPGLTAVHDAGVVNGVPYVVMEYVDGPTLAEMIARCGGLPPPAARAILVQVCAAVGALHERELVHRDIKPANIMIDRAGSVVVTDFGLACPRSVRGFGAEEPERMVAGTPGYMAPEMYGGEVTAKTDVYALGATALELLTGAGPSGTVAGMREAAERGEFGEDRLQSGGVPPAVVEVVRRCMNRDALYRPRSAGRVGELLDAGFATASPLVGTFSPDQLRRLAFAGNHPVAANSGAKQEEFPQRESAELDLPIAGTVLGLVSELAERKRKSGPAGGEEAVVAPPRPPAVPIWPMGSACAACGRALEGAPMTGPCPACGRAAGRALERKAARLARVHPATPVAWTRLVLCSVAGALVVAMLQDVFGAGERLGFLDTRAIPAQLAVLVWVNGLALGFAHAAYRAAAFRRFRGEPGVACGWCGYSLRELRTDRCPECGRGKSDHGRRGDRPPGASWRYLPRLSLWLMGALGLTVTMSQLFLTLVDWLPFTRTLGWILVSVPGFVLALWALHMIVRPLARFDGVARCGRCGADGAAWPTGWCVRCQGDESEFGSAEARTSESLVALPRRRLSPFKLLACGAGGAAALSALWVFWSLHGPATNAIELRIAEATGLWKNGMGPRWQETFEPNGEQRVWVQGVPATWVEVCVRAATDVAPYIAVTWLMFHIYGRVGFSRIVGWRRLMCGWCGSTFDRAASGACPACERVLNDPGTGRNAAAARRMPRRLWITALALSGMVAGWWLSFQMVVATGLMREIELGLRDDGSFAGMLKSFVLTGALLAWPSCVLGLIVHHFTAARTMKLEGLVRCGRCGRHGLHPPNFECACWSAQSAVERAAEEPRHGTGNTLPPPPEG